MKIFVTTLIGLAALTANAKTYSEEEFIKKVAEEVKGQVDKIKNKSVSELTKELLDKEAKLKLREIEIQKHQDEIAVSESEVAKKYIELTAQQKKIIGCVDKNENEAKARIGQLVEMVSNMKPEKAADVLSIQDSDIAVQILKVLDPKKASKIFNFMSKDISAKLQKQYLEMKKS